MGIYPKLVAAKEADKFSTLEHYWDIILEHFAQLAQATVFHVQFHKTTKTHMTSKELAAEHKKNNSMVNA